MCLICVEFDKLSLIECQRNFCEMQEGLGEHAKEVEKKIQDREIKEVIDNFNDEFDRIWNDLFENAGAVMQRYGKKQVNPDFYGTIVITGPTEA